MISYTASHCAEAPGKHYVAYRCLDVCACTACVCVCKSVWVRARVMGKKRKRKKKLLLLSRPNAQVNWRVFL